ncbi:hypothetical protein [Peterkaempfera bronchialis]|uniref:hypothetical protein n=1 Tax=Peterkaempfera bronchialis TaxID=2126346 RepID=UPI0013B3C2C1|nr:hypothetical protein [Peterkaempfera bronchialis]
MPYSEPCTAPYPQPGPQPGRRHGILLSAATAAVLVLPVTACSDGGGSTASPPVATTATATATPPTEEAPPSTEAPTSTDTGTDTSEPEPEPSDDPPPTEEPVPSEAPTTPARPTGDAASELWGLRYQGTAEVQVDAYDQCSVDGSRRFTGTRRYSLAGTLEIGRPRDGGDQSEANPFTLVLSLGAPSQDGSISLWSAGVASASAHDLAGNTRDPRLVLTYWGLQWKRGTVSGTLNDTHTREGVTLNLLNWSRPLIACHPEYGSLPGGFPEAIGTGATLSGDLDQRRARLTVSGNTADGLEQFRFTFSG